MNEILLNIIDSLKIDNEKSLDHLKSEYKVMRAGRANPHILDKIHVNYYGTMTPLSQMANISVPEPRVIAISLWDQTQVKEVVKAIQSSDLGLSPNDDGRIIRLVLPILTEERRKDMVKQVKKICEDTKVTVRNARRDCLELGKQMKKDGEISEDENALLEKEVQKIIDIVNGEIEKLAEIKAKEIMEV